MFYEINLKEDYGAHLFGKKLVGHKFTLDVIGQEATGCVRVKTNHIE